MNILVTGGAGFIGSHLVEYLLSEEARKAGLCIGKVVTLDSLTYAGRVENLPTDHRHVFIHGDILDGEKVAALLFDYDICTIFHLAAESHVDRSIVEPATFVMTNLVGTHCLLEQFRHHLEKNGTRYKRSLFLHASTDEVFGSLTENAEAFSELSPYAPSSPYSASKAGSDHLVRSYHRTYGLPVIVTNCSNNYGPRQFPEKLIPLMIDKALRGECLPVYGNGKNRRDWLYVTDHCRALVLIALRGKIGQTYLIGGKSELSNIEVVTAIFELIRELIPECNLSHAEELIEFVEDRLGHDFRYAVDSSRLENELGWMPCENFQSGLRKTVQAAMAERL